MRRLSVFLLAFLMVFSFISCDNSTKTPEDITNDEEEIDTPNPDVSTSEIVSHFPDFLGTYSTEDSSLIEDYIHIAFDKNELIVFVPTYGSSPRLPYRENRVLMSSSNTVIFSIFIAENEIEYEYRLSVERESDGNLSVYLDSETEDCPTLKNIGSFTAYKVSNEILLEPNIKGRTYEDEDFKYCLARDMESLAILNVKKSISNIPTSFENYEISEIASNAFMSTEFSNPNVVLGATFKKIGEQAFDGSNIESITLPDGLLEIKDYGFASCENLKEITIPGSVQQMGYSVFNNCTKLTTINVNWENNEQPLGWDSNWVGNCNAEISNHDGSIINL